MEDLADEDANAEADADVAHSKVILSFIQIRQALFEFNTFNRPNSQVPVVTRNLHEDFNREGTSDAQEDLGEGTSASFYEKSSAPSKPRLNRFDSDSSAAVKKRKAASDSSDSESIPGKVPRVGIYVQLFHVFCVVSLTLMHII